MAEDHHPDAERDGHDAASQWNHRQCDQEDRDDEESVMETGDIDRRRTEQALDHRDDELTPHSTADHGPHLGQVQIGNLDAERIESANQHEHLGAVAQQRDQHIEKDDCRGNESDGAAGGPLQGRQQPFADVLGCGHDRRPQCVGGDSGRLEGKLAQKAIDQIEATLSQGAEVGGFRPGGQTGQHARNLKCGNGDEQTERDDDGGQRSQHGQRGGHAGAELRA